MPSELVFYYSFYEPHANEGELTHIGFLATHEKYAPFSLYVFAQEIILKNIQKLNHYFEHDSLTHPSPEVIGFGYQPVFANKYEKSVALSVMSQWQQAFQKELDDLSISPIYELKDSDMGSDADILKGLKYCALAQKITKEKNEIENQISVLSKPHIIKNITKI